MSISGRPLCFVAKGDRLRGHFKSKALDENVSLFKISIKSWNLACR